MRLTPHYPFRAPKHASRAPNTHLDPPPPVLNPQTRVLTPTNTPSFETHVRAIVRAFLLFLFIFWHRKRVYEQSYTRFLCSPTACFDPQQRVLSPTHPFRPSTSQLNPPAVCFMPSSNVFRAQQRVLTAHPPISTTLAFSNTETPVRLLVRAFLFFNLFFDLGNACTIARTRVSYILSHFWLRNACTSNRTRVSFFIRITCTSN